VRGCRDDRERGLRRGWAGCQPRRRSSPRGLARHGGSAPPGARPWEETTPLPGVMTAWGPVPEEEGVRGIQPAGPAPCLGPLRHGRAPERPPHGRLPHPPRRRHGRPGPARTASRPPRFVARAPAPTAVGRVARRVTGRGRGRPRHDHRPIGPPAWGPTGRRLDARNRVAMALAALGQRGRQGLSPVDALRPLRRRRRPVPGALGIRVGPIPRAHLHARVGLAPRGAWVARTGRTPGEGRAAFQVHAAGARRVAGPQRPIIPAPDPGRGPVRRRRGCRRTRRPPAGPTRPPAVPPRATPRAPRRGASRRVRRAHGAATGGRRSGQRRRRPVRWQPTHGRTRRWRHTRDCAQGRSARGRPSSRGLRRAGVAHRGQGARVCVDGTRRVLGAVVASISPASRRSTVASGHTRAHRGGRGVATNAGSCVHGGGLWGHGASGSPPSQSGHAGG